MPRIKPNEIRQAQAFTAHPATDMLADMVRGMLSDEEGYSPETIRRVVEGTINADEQRREEAADEYAADHNAVLGLGQ